MTRTFMIEYLRPRENDFFQCICECCTRVPRAPYKFQKEIHKILNLPYGSAFVAHWEFISVYGFTLARKAHKNTV